MFAARFGFESKSYLIFAGLETISGLQSCYVFVVQSLLGSLHFTTAQKISIGDLL